MHPQDLLSVFHGFIVFLLYGSCTAQRRGLGRGGNQVADFDCPEEFGYYPHPTDCTQYYVCVFGGALLESCTGGLMYSHELQTCDWPRNVGCGSSGGDAGTISTVRVTDPRTRTPPQQRTINQPEQNLQVQQRVSQREEALRQRQAQELAQQQQQQVVYEDELGPAEEVETDRQQRVHRGQPSTLGQVQRDRDGLRGVKSNIHTPNVIPSGPGTVEKVSLVSYGGQRASQPRQQDQYSNELSDTLGEALGNVTWTESNELDKTDHYHSRFRRHATYSLSGQSLRMRNSGSTLERTKTIPVILVPDKSQSQRGQSLVPPSYPSHHNQLTRIPSNLPTSYNSQNSDKYQIIHHFNGNLYEQNKPQRLIKYSDNAHNVHDQPSESQLLFHHKYPPSLPPQNIFPFSHNLASGFKLNQNKSSFLESKLRNLFFPANHSQPDLDIVRLTKETIQTAFRPVHPSIIEDFGPIPQNVFQPFFEDSRPANDQLTLIPSSTHVPIYLESTKKTPIFQVSRPSFGVEPLKNNEEQFREDLTASTRLPNEPSKFSYKVTIPPTSRRPSSLNRNPEIRISYKPTVPSFSQRPELPSRTLYQATIPAPSHRPTTSHASVIESSLDVHVGTTESSLGTTSSTLFDPSTSVGKRKRKKTTTIAPPTPFIAITEHYDYNSTLLPEFDTSPTKITSTCNRNCSSAHLLTETTALVSERPTVETYSRRKPIKLIFSSTITPPTPPVKHIPEEYYENFKPFPTETPSSSSTYGKRQRLRLRLRPATTTSSTTKEDEITTMTMTQVTFKKSNTKDVRLEPVQEYPVTTPLAPVRNTSSRYKEPSQYDQYYQLYDEGGDLYNFNQYSQQQPRLQEQQVPSTTARSPVQQYRGQNSYKQQAAPLESPRDTYSQDVFVEDPSSQDYNDQDEQQYQLLASPKPSRSEDLQNRRKDTLSEPSVARPMVTNETIRRSDSFDPAILVPPPRSPPIFLTPPSEDRSYYSDHFPNIQNKEALIPPKNGGILSKSLNTFDSILTSFFNTVTQTRFNENPNSVPQTILRSEIGRIPHEPITETESRATTVKPPTIYQELPEKDFQTFFVEIEPKRNKGHHGFFITKPKETSETESVKNDPVVEITREMVINPDSQEIVFPPPRTITPQVVSTPEPSQKKTLDNLPRFPNVIEPHVQQAVSPNIDVLPLRAPSVKFNPNADELEYIAQRRKPTSTTTETTSTTTTPISTTPELPQFRKDPTPYQFIIVSTETPTPFARNPENEHRSDSRLTFRPEIRTRNKISASLEDYSTYRESQHSNVASSTENSNQDKPKIPETRFSSRFSTVEPVAVKPVNRGEIAKQYESGEEKYDNSKPSFRQNISHGSTPPTIAEDPFGRANLYSSREDKYESRTRQRNRLQLEYSENTSDNVASVGGTKDYNINEESMSRYENDSFGSNESTENPISEETSRPYSLKVSSKEVTSGIEPTESPTTTTKKSKIQIKTTTEAEASELRKPLRKVVKLHRGGLKNQRLSIPKVKRVRKPSTQTPDLIDDVDKKAFTLENEIHSTIKPIIVNEDVSANKNITRFRFTIEDSEFSSLPKEKANVHISTSSVEEEDSEEKKVVRPAYQPINLDTLESAEEPIPPRPSVEPATSKPTKSSRNPDHDRATTKPSRGRASLKPRQRGGSSYNLGVGNDISVNRGTPAPSRGTRPTLKPSTAIVSKASEFIDIYRYPPSRPANLYATPIPDKSAAKCRKDVCLLPDCSCGGKEIPGGYSPEEIPQLVLLTFDDSVNDLNKGLYADLFERGRVNPNGCPISATFYVSHEWTDYAQVQNLYANGHEMASHSVSHSFGEQFSQKKWTREIAGQREIIAAYGGVKLEDIRGMRAPFLAVGGNKMFKMLYDANFTYDSSMPIYENKPPSWPYTLDYKLFHDCMIPPCPTKSYPGVWEVPMVMWQDLNGGRCSMGDACSNPPTADGVYKMLIKNFERHFTSNRAPFGLFYHAAWFTHEHHKEGFIAFLDTIVNMPEVWLVTNWQALQWVRDPQPLSTVNNFPAFQCNEEKAKKCNNPKVCNLWHKSGVRYMRTCQPCPDVYPWTGKTGVRNSRVDNEIIDD